MAQAVDEQFGLLEMENGDGVRTDGIRGSSSLILNVSGLGGLANRTLRDAGLGFAGVFLFRALDRLKVGVGEGGEELLIGCLLYTSPSPRDKRQSRMPSSA